ncbi:MAG: TonB-dependent receptor [Bacteroidales bacterium]
MNIMLKGAKNRISNSVFRLLVFLSFSMAILSLNAQKNFSVSGVVNDNTGFPLPGVSVVVSNEKNGTVTDLDGNFTLNVGTKEAILEFSYMGFQPIKQKVKAGTNVTIVLQEDTKALDEVVVVGYGIVKKSDLTGSVAKVKSDVMEDRLVTSMADALKGQIAGVNIVTNDGAPGQSMDIRIRGANSLNASNTPLYVIDGVLMESAEISPGEIESLEILKDASATAIYGSRGANGVVIITTKRGQKGKAKINFSTNLSYQTPVRLYEMMNSLEYSRYRLYGFGGLRLNPSGATPSTARDFYDSEGYLYRLTTSGNSYTDMYEKALAGDLPNTDWQRAMLRNTLIQDYRLSITGADDNTAYSIMGSYFNQEGIVIASDFDRFNFRLNLDRNLSKSLKVGVNISANRSQKNSVVGNVIATMLSQPPTKKFSDVDWEPAPGETADSNNNPVYQARSITNRAIQEVASFRMYVDYSFAKIFKLNISGAYNLNKTKTERYYPNDVTAGGGKSVNGKAQTIFADRSDWLNENILYITPKAWGIHSADGMIGLTFQGKNTYGLNSENQNFAFGGLGVNNMGYGTVPIITTNNKVKSNMVSALARVNYRLTDKYLFTASIRADGSSNLGDGNKWSTFPSGAFAWRASEEDFIRNLNIFSNLKFRASVGVSGNAAIPPYQTLAVMDINGYPMNGNDPSFGLSVARNPNPKLCWEMSTQSDLGVDMGFFKNRLTAEIDLYYKRTRDLLLIEDVPTYLGYTSRWSNNGKVDGKGLEISLDGVIIKNKNFTWNSSYNMAFNRTEVRYISESGWRIITQSAQGATNFGILQEGKPLGQWYGYKVDGVYKNQTEVEQSGIKSVFGRVPRAGYQKYEDLNNDGVIDEADRQVIGCAQPKFTGGFNNNFSYKGIGLQVGIEFKYGGEVFNATRMSMEDSKGTKNQTKRAAKYQFYPTLYDKETGLLYEKGNEDYAYLRIPVAPNESADTNCKSIYIEDASYLRINDITLSYNFPKKMIQKAHISNLRVFGSVKNAFVWTKYSGYDPDVSTSSGANSDLLPGLDDSAYPRTRSFSLGVNLTL